MKPNELKKMLLEELSTFEVEKHNFHVLSSAKAKNVISPSIESGFEDKFNFRNMEMIINNVPSLRHSKIIKVLGMGMNGIAYLLDNDHVLKIMRSDEKNKFYKSFMSSQMQGKGGRDEVAIYDFGKITDQIEFVELAKVASIFEYCSRRGKDYEKWKADFENIIEQFVYFFFGANGADAPQYIEHFRDMPSGEKLHYILRAFISFTRDAGRRPRADGGWIEDASRDLSKELQEIQRNELVSLFRTFIKMFEKMGINGIEDLQINNFGVLPQSIMTNDPVFIVFDP